MSIFGVLVRFVCVYPTLLVVASITLTYLEIDSSIGINIGILIGADPDN